MNHLFLPRNNVIKIKEINLLPKTNVAMVRPLTIESLNINGFGDNRKRKKILNHFFRRQVDIVLLQETYTTPTTAQHYKEQWKKLSRKHDSHWNSLASNSCGVAILISDQAKVKVIDTKQDLAGRVLTLQVKLNNNIFQIQSLYAPTRPESRPQFYQDLGEFFFKEGQIICGGDFNMVEAKIDRTGGEFTSAHCRGLLQLNELKESLSLTDVWRDQYPDYKAYSWSATDRKVWENGVHTKVRNRTRVLQYSHLNSPIKRRITIAGRPCLAV